MSLHVLGCPTCNQPFQVGSEQAGKIVRCPSCKNEVGVPESLAPPKNVAASNPVFNCPECDGVFGITADMQGQNVVCPHCQKTVLVGPVESNPPAPAPAAPPPSPQKVAELDDGVPKIRTGRKKKKIQIGLSEDMFAPNHPSSAPPSANPPSTPPSSNPSVANPEEETIGPIKPIRSRRSKRRGTTKKIGPVFPSNNDLSPPPAKTKTDPPAQLPETTPVLPTAKSTTTEKKEPLPSPPSSPMTVAKAEQPSEPSEPVKPKKRKSKSKKTKKSKKSKSKGKRQSTNPAAPTESNPVASAPAEITNTAVPESNVPVAPAPASNEPEPAEPLSELPPVFSAPKKSKQASKLLPAEFDDDDTNEVTDWDSEEEAEPVSPLAVPDSVATLLPPRFEVDDPMMSNRGSKETKVLLPAADGGTTKVDQRFVTIEHKGQEIQLIALSPEERIKYRRKITIISLLLGVLMMVMAFVILQLL